MLKTKLTKALYDALPAHFKTEYKLFGTSTDTYVLDTETVDGLALEDATSLRNALEQERTQKTNAERTVGLYKALGEPTALADIVREHGVFKNDSSSTQQKVDTQVLSIKNQLEANFNAQKADYDNKIKSYHEQLEYALVDSSVIAAVQKHKGYPEILLPAIRNQVKMEPSGSNGKFTVRVTGQDGNIRLTKKTGQGINPTDPMGLDELVEEYKSHTVFSRAFEPTKASGSGASGGSTAGGSGSGAFRMSNETAKTNPVAYRVMRDEAMKVGQSVELHD